MITKDELTDIIAALESQPHLSIKEDRYLKWMLELLSLRQCRHQWNELRLVESGGAYQYCTLCGVKRVAE